MAKENGNGIQETDDGGVECKIKSAMCSRVDYFRDKSDSLTFEGVRRLLEKDLGMQEFSLDSHKRFVKQLLLDSLNQTADSVSKGSTKKDILAMKKEAKELSDICSKKLDVRGNILDDVEKMEDSPVMGLLHMETPPETLETENREIEVPTEAIVKKALTERATYILDNSEAITMAGLRRMLEEDLNLKKNSLDPLKKFISQQLDELMKSFRVSQRKNIGNSSSIGNTSSEKVSCQHIDEMDEEEEMEAGEGEEEEEVQPKSSTRKRKSTGKNINSLKKKQKEPTNKSSLPNDVGNASDDSHSETSADKLTNKKDSSTPAYGKSVEHLKSVIKSCSMSVPPSIYKKVNQFPENKREAQLIKELKDILSKEGLTSNPSEKEIKEVRRRKERSKELEGIDTSNIVSSSRRRSTVSYVAPLKPKIPVESDDSANDTEEDNEDDDSNEDEEDENLENDEGEGDDEKENEGESEEVGNDDSE